MDRVTLDQIRAWLDADLLAEPELNLTSYEHAAQTAELAPGEGVDDDLVVAAFLHEVGHAEGGPRSRSLGQRPAGGIPAGMGPLADRAPHHGQALGLHGRPSRDRSARPGSRSPDRPIPVIAHCIKTSSHGSIDGDECVEYENATPLHRLSR